MDSLMRDASPEDRALVGKMRALLDQRKERDILRDLAALCEDVAKSANHAVKWRFIKCISDDETIALDFIRPPDDGATGTKAQLREMAYRDFRWSDAWREIIDERRVVAARLICGLGCDESQYVRDASCDAFVWLADEIDNPGIKVKALDGLIRSDGDFAEMVLKDYRQHWLLELLRALSVPVEAAGDERRNIVRRWFPQSKGRQARQVRSSGTLRTRSSCTRATTGPPPQGSDSRGARRWSLSRGTAIR